MAKRKISDEDIEKIRQLYQDGKTQQELADMFGVSIRGMKKIFKREEIRKLNMFPPYNPNHPLENLRASLVKKYAKHYYNILNGMEFGPDINDLYSIFEEVSLRAIASYDKTLSSFPTYCKQKFKWAYINYSKKLENYII